MCHYEPQWNRSGTTRSVSSTTSTTIPSDVVNEYIHVKVCMSENMWHKY
jgi:hypothetical protein